MGKINEVFPEEHSSLEDGFRKPPRWAGVKTWWHWMNGNISAEGITLDLEAMKNVGVIGFQLFQVGTGIPKGPVDFGSSKHINLLQHVVREADRLGLEFVMHNCPGWSSSGGPWITPEYSMKRLVWSETYITGGKRVKIKLPKPPSNLSYYQDVFVLAFPSLAGEKKPFKDFIDRIVSSSGPVDVNLLTDGDPTTGIDVYPAESGQPAFLRIELTEPLEVRSIAAIFSSLERAGFIQAPSILSLEASEDGIQFRKICDLRMPPTFRRRLSAPTVMNFPVVRAKYFRLTSPKAFRIYEIRLFWAARIADWPVKANFTDPMPFSPVGLIPVFRETVEDPVGSAIDPNAVIDVTAYMDEQGQLDWDAPPGDWTILRFGYTTVGTTNHPAPEGGEGLECDKYSKEAIEFHFENFFGKILPSLKSLAAKGMAGALIDSYEVGYQNWTKDFPEEFQKRCGYDLRKYMPAMTGRIVGSADISERFLWDLRRVQAEMMADNYYGHFTEICHKYGMKSYAEPYRGGPFNEMQAGARVDVPMGEFWVARDDGHERTIKLAASCAHIYGKRIVGAESFTGAPLASSWQEHPYLMKSLGDFMFTRGLNQIIFHTYAHQPHPTAKPGMTMGPFGFFFNRNTTWWEQGKAWIEYLTRCQYMLQQGKFVADLLYFVGEDAPVLVPHESQLNPPLPKGYDYDFVDTEAILTRLNVKDGRIVTPDGMSYRLLILGERRKITLELLRKIRDMVKQGMWLVGSKPDGTPSLTGYPESEEEAKRIINDVWGNMDGETITERSFGKGRVFWGVPLLKVLDKLGLKPDFEYTARSSDALINYIHRKVEDEDIDIYFVANRRRRTEDLVCIFRVEGKQPELWNPETGEITPSPIYDVIDGRTYIPLRLGPNGSIFIVFRPPASKQRFNVIEKDGEVILGTKPYSISAPGLYPNITNNFTISVWVKPEVNASLPGIDVWPFRSGACWLFYPPEGEVLYGKGHAACGLVAGRNGIAVYERSFGAPEVVLVAPLPLEGWTHIALIYNNGAPSLFVNGKLVCVGRRSNKIVHPGIGEPYTDKSNITQPTYTIGDMSEPKLFTEVLSEGKIRELASAGPPKPEEPPIVELVGDGEAKLLIWQNGKYTLKDNEGHSLTFQVSEIEKPIEINGPWHVIFPPDSGAPPEIVLPELMSLHKHPNDGVKYFSGTATYRKQFEIPANFKLEGKRVYLDLGRVENIAEIQLNGKNLGILWKPPYRIDVTDAIQIGLNDLEIRVTNVWVNRLIGDEQQPEEYEYSGRDQFGIMGGVIKKLPEWYVQGKPKPPSKRVTFVTWRLHNKDDPLLESGLIGPVRILTAIRLPIKINE